MINRNFGGNENLLTKKWQEITLNTKTLKKNLTIATKMIKKIIYFEILGIFISELKEGG